MSSVGISHEHTHDMLLLGPLQKLDIVFYSLKLVYLCHSSVSNINLILHLYDNIAQKSTLQTLLSGVNS